MPKEHAMTYLRYTLALLASTLLVGMACGEKGPAAPVAVPVDAPAAVGDQTAGDADEGHAADGRSAEQPHAVAVDTGAKDPGQARHDNPQEKPAPANRESETDTSATPYHPASGENTVASRTVAVEVVAKNPVASPPEESAPEPPAPGSEAVPKPATNLGPVRRVTLSEKWSVEAETGDWSHVVVGAKHVFVAAYDTQKAHKVGLMAIDKETGDIAWRKPLVTEVKSFGDIVVTWRPFQVLDAQTGKQLWTRKGIMNYMDVAVHDELIALISLERGPLRYRLTVAELRTGKEIYHVEASGVNRRDVEASAVLSFDDQGLWVANRRIPDELDARAEAWTAIVEDANHWQVGFPCHAVTSDRYVFSRNEKRSVQLVDRSDAKAPRWTLTEQAYLGFCDMARAVIDGEYIYAANALRDVDANGDTKATHNGLRLIRYSAGDGQILWQIDGMDPSRGILPMSFGLLLPGLDNPRNFPDVGTLRGVDHDGREIEVIGDLPQRSVVDNDVVFAFNKGRVMRIEVRTEP